LARVGNAVPEREAAVHPQRQPIVHIRQPEVPSAHSLDRRRLLVQFLFLVAVQANEGADTGREVEAGLEAIHAARQFQHQPAGRRLDAEVKLQEEVPHPVLARVGGDVGRAFKGVVAHEVGNQLRLVVPAVPEDVPVAEPRDSVAAGGVLETPPSSSPGTAVIAAGPARRQFAFQVLCRMVVVVDGPPLGQDLRWWFAQDLELLSTLCGLRLFEQGAVLIDVHVLRRQRSSGLSGFFASG
jgi:hypothetical protein